MVSVYVARKVRYNNEGRRPVDRNGFHPKMKIVVEGGDAFEVPYAPRETTLDGVTPRFDTIDRGGREPLLLRGGGQLQTMSMDLVFGWPNPDRSVEPQLKRLRRLAGSGKRLRVKLDGTAATYRWRLTGFSQQVLARQFGTNEPTRALCSLTFTQASDPVVEVGPVTGGHNGGGGRGGKDDDEKKRPKFYVVKKGDTLQSIAKRFYGKASLWQRLADVQEPKIRDPKKLKVGRRLRLPPLQGVGTAASASAGD